MLYQVDTGSGLIGMKYITADSETEATEKAKDILFAEKYSNCCGASDIYNGNLDNNEGVCTDCGEHCEIEGEITMKLYELPRESKLVVPISDGKNHEATFHHIDGAYSLITLGDGTAVHLHANTNMKKVGDHYEIDEANQ